MTPAKDDDGHCSPTGSDAGTEGVGIKNRVIGLADIILAPRLSSSTIYAWIETGHVPRQHKLGPRRVGYLVSDIDAWIGANYFGSMS